MSKLSRRALLGAISSLALVATASVSEAGRALLLGKPLPTVNSIPTVSPAPGGTWATNVVSSTTPASGKTISYGKAYALEATAGTGWAANGGEPNQSDFDGTAVSLRRGPSCELMGSAGHCEYGYPYSQ